MKDYLEIANSPLIWGAAIPITILVVIQAVIFLKRAYASAHLVDLSISDAHRAFKIGAISAIGPAMGVFVVMLGLMAVIGGPLAWMRLSIIGAAPTELAAASMAAKAMGKELTSPEYGLLDFANATWVMALNGSAWLLSTALFTHKIEGVTHKISGGDPKKVKILMIAAMCGAFGYLFGNVLKNIFDAKTQPIAVAGISSAIAIYFLEKLTKRFPKLGEYNLGIAMLIGMFCAVAFKRLV
jgi:hypothetical protein